MPPSFLLWWIEQYLNKMFSYLSKWLTREAALASLVLSLAVGLGLDTRVRVKMGLGWYRSAGATCWNSFNRDV